MKKFNFITIFVLIAASVGMSSCDIFDPQIVTDPNNPAQEAFLRNASKTQLQSLVTGLESRNRGGNTGIINLYGSFGREFYPMFESDPRFIAQWMGRDPSASATTDGNFFGSGGSWNGPYNAIRQGNILIGAANNSDQISDQERNGYLGYAKTIQGFQFLIPLVSHDNIRIDVDDPLNPGPFVSSEEALTSILNLLDEAEQDLENAGGSFAFTLHSGFVDFNTPSTMINLNRAIKARAAIYAEEWQVALDALEEAKPFFELATGEGVMNKGAYHVYGNPPDAFNPLYYPRNAETSQILMVHPDMVENAIDGDARVENKFFTRDNPVSLQGLTSQYQDDRFDSNTDPFPMMRNEELILIYAEANAQLGNIPQAIAAINIIRTTWNIGPYTGSETQSALIDEILYQRRYSLWGEFGHSWIDALRYDRLNTLPLDDGQLWPRLAKRTAEINWDNFAAGN